MKHLQFFATAVKMVISQKMVYKTNFIIRMLTLMSFDLVLPLVTILIYLNSRGFPGWSFNEILLFQGIFISVNALDRLFFQRIDWSLTHQVRDGTFDRYLVLPVNTLAYLSFTNFGLEHLADLLVGTSVAGYAVFQLGIKLTAVKILLAAGYLLLALLFLTSLALIKYSLIVWAVRIGRIGELFRTIKSYGEYPVDIYNNLLSSFLRYVLPLSVLAYYPSTSLLGFAGKQFIIVALIIIIIFTGARSLWSIALKQYTSAGG